MDEVVHLLQACVFELQLKLSIGSRPKELEQQKKIQEVR